MSSVLLLLGFMMAPHAICAERDNGVTGQIDHIVIAWLKHPGSAVARRRFVEVTKSLADLPGVLSHDVGVALPSQRSVVDSSYDVAAVIRFKDRASLTAYLQHPKHEKAVKYMLKPLIDKLLVYDVYLK